MRSLELTRELITSYLCDICRYYLELAKSVSLAIPNSSYEIGELEIKHAEERFSFELISLNGGVNRSDLEKYLILSLSGLPPPIPLLPESFSVRIRLKGNCGPHILCYLISDSISDWLLSEAEAVAKECSSIVQEIVTMAPDSIIQMSINYASSETYLNSLSPQCEPSLSNTLGHIALNRAKALSYASQESIPASLQLCWIVQNGTLQGAVPYIGAVAQAAPELQDLWSETSGLKFHVPPIIQIESARQTFEKEPGNLESAYLYFDALGSLGASLSKEIALTGVEKARQTTYANPDSWRAHYLFARVLSNFASQYGDLPLYLTEFVKEMGLARELDPEHSKYTTIALASYLTMCKRFSEAAQEYDSAYFRKYLLPSEEQWYVYVSMFSDAYKQAGDMEAARKVLTDAKSRAGENEGIKKCFQSLLHNLQTNTEPQ